MHGLFLTSLISKFFLRTFLCCVLPKINVIHCFSNSRHTLCILTDIIFLVSSLTDDPLRREILDSDQAIIARAVLSLVYFGGCAFMIAIALWGEELWILGNGALQFEERMKRR
jgi:hypothetical protein